MASGNWLREKVQLFVLLLIYNMSGVESGLNPGIRHLYTSVTTSYCRICNFLEIIVFGDKKMTGVILISYFI